MTFIFFIKIYKEIIEKIANTRNSHNVFKLVTLFIYMFSILYIKLFFISRFTVIEAHEIHQYGQGKWGKFQYQQVFVGRNFKFNVIYRIIYFDLLKKKNRQIKVRC